MPEQLEAELQLGISGALSSVDELRSAIEEALQGAAGAFEEEFARVTGSLPDVEVAVEADASEVAPAIDAAVGDADATVAVEGDGFDQLTLGIEDAVAGAEATITVEADTADAEAAIADLGDQAESTSASLGGGGLGGGTDAFAGAASLAEGSAAGLGSTIGGLGGKSAAAYGLLGALAAVTGVMYNEATEATGATQRFEATLGSMADRVENLRDIQGLNTDLGTLALTLGSDDDKIRSVAARMFELATASGKSEDQASVFTEQLVAMGARAVALNPQLGDVGDVADGLSTALVRGGRFAAKYGLDLNQADINARALKDTNKLAASELTFVEKAMAGAAIASEKYGGNLDKVIAQGAENAITKQRRLKQTIIENLEALGTPLVAPIFDLLEAGIPVAEDVGRIIQILARAALPALTTSLQAVEPILELVADVLEAIPGPVLAIVASMLLFRGPAGQVGGILKSIGGEGQSMGDKLGRAAIGLGLFIDGVDKAGQEGEAGAIGIGQMAASGALMGSTFGPQGALIGGVAGAVAGLTVHLISGGESVEDYRDKFRALGSELQGLSSKQVFEKFVDQLGDTDRLRAFTGDAKGLREELRALATTSPGAAQQVIDQLSKLRDEAGKPLFTKGELESLNGVIEKGAESYAKHTREAEKAAAADKAVADAATDTSTAYDRAKASADAYRASLEQLDSGHTSAFQAETSFTEALTKVQEALGASFGGFDTANVLALGSRDALAGAANSARDYSAAILESGGSQAAADAPLRQLTTSLTEQLATFGRSPGDIAQLLNSLGLISFATPDVQAAAAAQGIAVKGIGTDAQTAAGDVSTAMGDAKGSIDNSGLPEAAGTAGQQAADKLGQGTDQMPDKAAAALARTGGQIVTGGLQLGSLAYSTGIAVGELFSEGIAEGIGHAAGVQAAAREVVARAEAAARAEADSHSPSLLFAALGEDLAAGVGLGLKAGAAEVARASRGLVGTAAGSFPTPGGATAAGPTVSVQVGPISVTGVGSDADARRYGRIVGQEAERGVMDALTRRGAIVAARS